MNNNKLIQILQNMFPDQKPSEIIQHLQELIQIVKDKLTKGELRDVANIQSEK